MRGGELKRLSRSRLLPTLAVLPLALVLIASSGPINEEGQFDAYLTNAGAQCSIVQATERVSQLTGPESPSQTAERWNVFGTDLGIGFEQDDVTYMAFGDTWGRAGTEQEDWRSNTLAVVEPDPTHGYVITEMVTGDNGEAIELLPSVKQSGIEYTVNPTAAIAVGDRLYMHYMSVNDWDLQWWGYKYPIVNGAGLAYSDDGGRTWTLDEQARWQGDTPFTQAAMVEDDGYVYIFGTPAGRFGAAHLLRVEDEHLLEPEHYEYWAGDDWNDSPAELAVLIPWPVGELSVQWSEYLDRWLMMYKNEVHHTIVLRTAEQLEGPWSEEQAVVTGAEYPSLYAPYMLPEIDGPEVYFTRSTFEDAYQVFVMRTTLGRCE